jgi:hypothetical protein
LLGKGAPSPTTSGATNAASKPESGPAKPPGEQKGAPSESEPASDAWFAAITAHGDRVVDLVWLNKNHPQKSETSGDQQADRALALLKYEKLAEVDKACAAGTYKNGRGATLQQVTLEPDAVCPLIAKRETIAKSALREWATAFAMSFIWNNIERPIEEAKTRRKTYLSDAVEGVDGARYRAYVSKRVGKYFEAAGEPFPEVLQKRLDDLAAAYLSMFDGLAASGAMPKAAAPDAGAEAAIRKAYERTPGIQIKKVWMTSGEWKTVKNDYGVTLRRYKDGGVLVKTKTGDRCLWVPASVGQAYKGGAFSSEYGVDTFTDGTPVKCP